MIDVARVAEIRSLPTKEAKEGLIEYAKEFGINLKSRPYDKMVEDLKSQLEARANEPMPENQEGLTMAELIAADDAAQGKVVHDEVNEAATQLLIDSVELPELKVSDIKEEIPAEVIITPKPVVETIQLSDEAIEQLKASTEEYKDLVPFEPKPGFLTHEKLKEIFDETKDEYEAKRANFDAYAFPKNYSPSLNLIGNNPGYISLQWWVFDFIQSNPNWKSEIELFTHESGKKDLYSLLYYIQRNGSVRIRETKNSRFHDLT